MKNKGFTLVELIVTFAIFSLLMASVAAILPNFAKQYSYVQNSVQVDKIGTTLLDLIESELSYADTVLDIKESNNNSVVEYRNSNLIKVRMGIVDADNAIYNNIEPAVSNEQKNYLDKGLLVLVYYPVDSTSSPSVWGYTENYYIKNRIISFKVEKASDVYRDNILKITLTLKHDETGQEKTFTRYIECKNISSIN